MVAQAEKESATPDHAGGTLQNALRSTRRQKSRSRSSRCSTAFPAMMAALIAPIEVPMIQSGSTFASCSAS